LRLKDNTQPDPYAEAKDYTQRLIHGFAKPGESPVNDASIPANDLQLNWKFFKDDDPEGRPNNTEDHHLTWTVEKFYTDKIQYSVLPS
jgi:hypothetical protein